MRYIGKKLAAMMITLLCISFLVYLAFDLIPGDAALAALGTGQYGRHTGEPRSAAGTAGAEQAVPPEISGMAGALYRR